MNNRRNQLLIIGGVVAVVVVIFLVVIANSGQSTTYNTDYAALPQSRTEDGAYVIGNPDAPITVVEFADWACPHCQEYRPTIERFIEQYVATGLAKFEFRVFPTAGGQYTVFAGQMADCAENQQEGAFWRAYPILYRLAETHQWSDEVGRDLANQLGLNYSEMLTCASEESNRVTTDSAYGQARGVSGTPAVMIRVNDGEAQWITANGLSSNAEARQLPNFDMLAALVNSAGS
jgi:protein-disulfide isomerase